MLPLKMLEVVRVVGCLNFIRLPVRKNTTKAMIMKKRMKEDKENFGPLLETAKERKKKSKSTKKNNKIERPDVPESEISKNNVNAAELTWTLSSIKQKNLRFIRKTNEDDKQKSCISRTAKNNEVPTTRKVLESTDSNGITKIPIHSIKIEKHNEQDEEIVPLSSTNIERKVEDAFVKDMGGSDDKSCYESIREETLLKSEGNDTSYFPIANTTKGEDDKWKSTGIVSLKPEEQNEYCLPGVTRILNATMSEEAKLILAKWKKKKIKELGEEGFDEYCKSLLEDSKIMHLLIEKSLRREELPEVPQHLKPSFNSVKLVLKDLSHIRMLESHVVHPTLGYRGFIDCVASYRGNLCIIDWKKSEKIKTLSTTYDSPLQVSAYIGALNADPNYPFQVKSGLVVIAYTRGQPPSVFEFTAAKLEFYWREWLKRLEKYKSMQNI